MLKNAFLVFQDCVECEPVLSWLASDWEIAAKNGIKITKLPFFAKGAPALIRKARKAGVTLPFFSDGERVTKHLPKLLELSSNEETPVQNVSNASRKGGKRRKKVESEPKNATN